MKSPAQQSNHPAIVLLLLLEIQRATTSPKPSSPSLESLLPSQLTVAGPSQPQQ